MIEKMLSYARHDIVPLPQLDDFVHEVQRYAFEKGMIPIAGVISRPLDNEMHEIVGFGHNELADGIPGVHGETGAVKNMGRIEQGYGDLVATSSLSPCPFCQCTLARHLGIKKIRILDDKNYLPDKSDYEKAGMVPEIFSHSGIEELFHRWVTDDNNAVLWNRDIGISTGEKLQPPSFTVDQQRKLMDRAERLAAEGMQRGEAPIGALVVDEFGQVAGSGFPSILSRNDPSAVAAMTAWRAAGSRDDWGRYTLFLSSGPDPIAYSMLNIFGFGQLIVGSTRVYSGLLDEVHSLGKPVVLMNNAENADHCLEEWIGTHSISQVREYLGADYGFSEDQSA